MPDQRRNEKKEPEKAPFLSVTTVSDSETLSTLIAFFNVFEEDYEASQRSSGSRCTHSMPTLRSRSSPSSERYSSQ